MKVIEKTVFFCLLFLIVPFAIAAQTQSENLSFKSGTWSYDYYEGDQQISFDTFVDKLNSKDKQLADMFKSGKNLSISGNVIGCIGAFCFGWDLGTRLGGGEGNTALLVGGGSVMVGGMIMYYVGEGKMKKALTLYKDNSVAINIRPSTTGLGICLTF